MPFYRNSKRPPRVFMGLSEVAGYYRHLLAGFQELEVPARFFSPTEHRFQYHGVNWAGRHLTRVLQFYATVKHKKCWQRSALKCYFQICQWLLFAWAAASHDVFIYSFRGTFDGMLIGRRGYRELPILKALGKTIIYVFHGSDARPPYLNGNYQDDTPDELWKRTQQKLVEFSHIERHADAIINHAPTSQFHNRPVVQWLQVGIPFSAPPEDGGVASRAAASHAQVPVRILHAPSIQKTKGTTEVRKAIETLQAEGLSIEFVELVNVPNHQVLSMIQSVDIVVDELYSDTFLAGLATEAAYYGVPTVVCGLDLDKLAASIPQPITPPVQSGQPEALLSNLRALVLNPEERQALGQAAKQFVRQQWSPSAVASRYMRIIQGDIPADWYYNAHTDTPFVYGWGMPRDVRQQVVQRYIDAKGTEGLGFGSKTSQIQALLESIQTSVEQHSSAPCL
jgi:hypothetical protein